MLKVWFLSLRPLFLGLFLLSGSVSAQQYIGSLSVNGIAISHTDTYAIAHVTAVNSREILVHTSSGGYWECGDGLDTIYDFWFNLGGCRVPGSGSSQGAFSFTVKVFSSVNLTVPSGAFTLQVMPSGYAPSASTPVPFISGADPDSGAGKDACCVAGQPINLTNGNTWVTQVDYSVPGVGGGLALTRTWNSLWQTNQPIQDSGMFGHSWRSNLEERIQLLSSPDGARYWRGDGTSWTFNYSVGSGYTLADPVNERATLVYDSASQLFTLTLANGQKRIFNQPGYLQKIVDRNSNEIVLAYNGTKITGVTSGARSLTFTYGDPNFPDLVTQVQDAASVATYQYDTSGRLATVTFADGTFNTFTYDANNLLLEVKDTAGKILEAHTYDSGRRGLTSERANGIERVTVAYPEHGRTIVTDSLGRTTTYLYHFIGRRRFLDSISGDGCTTCGGEGTKSFTYDTAGNRISGTNDAGAPITYLHDANGNVTQVKRTLTAGVDQIYSYTYNSFGQVLTATDPLGNVTTNVYDSKGNLLSVTLPSPDGVLPGPVTTFEYDVKGQLTKVTDPRNGQTTLTYTPAGMIATVTDADNKVTVFEYDARGNRTAVIDALNQRTTFVYNNMDRLTSVTTPDLKTVSYGYDSRGRRNTVTDQLSSIETTLYDDADRVTQVAVSGLAPNARYTYDTEHNLLTVKDAADRVTSYEYDARRRLTKTTFPSGKVETYTYDANGNLLTKTDRKSQTVTYEYDALDRLKKKTYPDSSTVTYTYDLANRLTQVVDASGTYGFTYDNLGRLMSTSTQYTHLPGQTFTVNYAYDAAGNRTSLSYPIGGATVAYGYDALNRLNSVADSAAGSFGLTYDALGRRTSLTRPNNVNATYAYDLVSNLSRIENKLATNIVDGWQVEWNAAGNRYRQAALPTGTWYRAVMQMRPWGYTVQEENLGRSFWLYFHDNAGNRTNAGCHGCFSATETHNESNQQVTGGLYTYDDNGNRTSVTAAGTNPPQVTTYTWDYENRLTSVTLPSGAVVSFKYDPFGRRIQKSSAAGTKNYLYDGAAILQELDASGAVTSRYLHGPGVDEPWMLERGTNRYYYTADSLGSITGVLNQAGTRIESNTYRAFGENVLSSPTLGQPFGYTGREYDSETGLYYYRARYYEPKFGRFISEDPIRFEGGMNFYAYVGNNPVTFTDPFGLAEPGTLSIGALWAWGSGGVAATGKGAAVLAGAGTGAAIVGAGTAGWFIGRGIGHIPIGDGRDIDDAVTSAFASIITFARGDARTNARSWRAPTCKPRNRKECEAMYVADTALCTQLKSRACHAQAAERYAACLAGKEIPPLPWRKEQ